MTPTLAQAASIFAVRTRIAQLDSNGFPAPGNNVYVTNTMVKATYTPVLESGDDIAIKAGSGDLVSWAKHGDMVKYGTFNIEFAIPDPGLEAVISGGTILNDNTAAAGAPTGLAVAGQITLGTLPAGNYGYTVTQYNSYGESIAGTEVDATNTGSTSANVLSGMTLAAGSLGWRFYGRTPGLTQKMGQMVGIGSQATSGASGTGTVASLAVTALTKPIPAGYTFQISGDTNTTKIVFTTLVAAGVGAVSLSVSPSQSVTTTIAAAAIVPVFVDAGSVTPSGQAPTTDLTAGPGNATGYQAPALGPVANPNGVSVEFFEKRIINGYQDSTYPYIHWIFPRVVAMHTMPRDMTNANVQTIMEGQNWENPNWGSGPVGDWPFDSTKIMARAACGSAILPVAGVAPVAAAF